MAVTVREIASNDIGPEYYWEKMGTFKAFKI
jgi:hypothetical protein